MHSNETSLVRFLCCFSLHVTAGMWNTITSEGEKFSPARSKRATNLTRDFLFLNVFVQNEPVCKAVAIFSMSSSIFILSVKKGKKLARNSICEWNVSKIYGFSFEWISILFPAHTTASISVHRMKFISSIIISWKCFRCWCLIFRTTFYHLVICEHLFVDCRGNSHTLFLLDRYFASNGGPFLPRSPALLPPPYAPTSLLLLLLLIIHDFSYFHICTHTNVPDTIVHKCIWDVKTVCSIHIERVR